MDLINRQEIHDNVAARYPDSDATQYSIGYADAINDVLKDIRYMPSAQPEIIRCKDCKHKPHASEFSLWKAWNKCSCGFNELLLKLWSKDGGGRMMLIKGIVCLFKGHDVNPDESIVADTMKDKRNWLCQCHRCGLYEMHDGAMLNTSITLTKSQALKTKRDFERDVLEFRRRLRGEEE